MNFKFNVFRINCRNKYTVLKWVVDCPDLSPAANALLKTRKVAIEKGEDEEVFQLAKELWKLRVSVKEKDKSQYYRY